MKKKAQVWLEKCICFYSEMYCWEYRSLNVILVRIEFNLDTFLPLDCQTKSICWNIFFFSSRKEHLLLYFINILPFRWCTVARVLKSIVLATPMSWVWFPGNTRSLLAKYIHRRQSKLLWKKAKMQCINISGGPLSALTCCVNARLLSAIKKISPLIYSQSWVGSWVYTTHYDDFHPDILARMYT